MAIEISEVSKQFPKKRVLDGITASFPTGDVSVIVGQNGSGKSTLLNCVVGLLPFERGNINVEIAAANAEHEETRHKCVKYDLSSDSPGSIPAEIRQRIGYIFQHKALWQHLKVIDNLVHPLTKVRKLPYAAAMEQAQDYLRLIDLKPEHYKRYPNELSGGEQRKVAIARTLAMEPELLLIDELEANLDHSALKLTLEIIKSRFIDRNKTLVIVSHNLQMLEEFMPHISILHDGRIIESCKGVDDLLSKEYSSPEIAKTIRDSVDSSTTKWFVASQSLQTAIRISETNLAERDLSKALTEIGNSIFKLICIYDPTANHLLLISTKIVENGLDEVRIRCAQKTCDFNLDGSEASTLTELVTVNNEWDSRGDTYSFKEDYVTQLECRQGVTLGKKAELQHSHSQYHSLIDRFFDKNVKGLSYQFTERHHPIPNAYRIGIPIPATRDNEKKSYYEFSKRTKHVYLIGCSVDDEVKGVISIDTDSEKRWSDFMVQQLVFVGNMVAIAIKNHELTAEPSAPNQVKQ